MNTKKSNMKKLSEMNVSLTKEPSLITMPLKLKSNTSREKLKKPSWLRNLLKELMREFNTFLLKHKLFTILREITMLLSQPKLELNILEFLKMDIKEVRLEKLEDKTTMPDQFKQELSKELKLEELLLTLQEEIMLML